MLQSQGYIYRKQVTDQELESCVLRSNTLSAFTRVSASNVAEKKKESKNKPKLEFCGFCFHLRVSWGMRIACKTDRLRERSKNINAIAILQLHSCFHIL